jgi:uncharacterized protein (TIGR02001 family)
MQKLMLGLAAAILSVPAGAGASDIDFSGSVGVSSDYVWRGITKSAGDPIFSASARFDLESGPYANINFFYGVDFPAATEEDKELDYTVGYARDINGLFGLDVGYTRHTYVGSELGIAGKAAVGELHAAVSKGPASVTAYRVVGEDFGKEPYVIGSLNATDFIQRDLPFDVSVFYGTQFPAKGEERVNDYGLVTSVTFKEWGNLNYKLSKRSVDNEEETHTVGITINF